MCVAPQRERHVALSRGVCAASNSRHEFSDVDEKTPMLKGNTLIMYVVLQVSMGHNDGQARDGADDGDDSGRIAICARGDARACRPR
eukprot:244192-Pyramimonas_sp.AAC.1